MTTFTWIPEFGSSADIEPNVAVQKFGDGYEQRQAKGMNSQAETWSLAFANRDASEFADIIAFLKARGAVEAFNWTTPDGDAIVVVCRKWSKTPQKGNLRTINATFEQVFEP